MSTRRLPPLPKPDRKGNYPAVEFGCAAIARGILRDRVKAGLIQKQLAKLAGIRVETLCRIETGRHLPSVPTIEKIDRALKQTFSKGSRRG
jgi:DNA-binding XRE family transcriptional regulator